MVIVVVNEIAKPSSNPGVACLRFTYNEMQQIFQTMKKHERDYWLKSKLQQQQQQQHETLHFAWSDSVALTPLWLIFSIRFDYKAYTDSNFSIYCNLLSFCLRCGSWLYEWGTQWESNSHGRFGALACEPLHHLRSPLTKLFCLDMARGYMNRAPVRLELTRKVLLV